MYYFSITIDKTKVQGTNSNFIYLFDESANNIPAGFWSHVIDSNGFDIRFFDTDGLTELKREIVLYSSITNIVEVWVQIPSISDIVDKVIWCKYGESVISNSSEVWTDSGIAQVNHLKSDGSNVADSAYGITGTLFPPATSCSGVIHEGVDCTSGRIRIPHSVYSNPGSNSFAVSFWMNLVNIAAYDPIIQKQNFGSEQWGVYRGGSDSYGSAGKRLNLFLSSASDFRGGYTVNNYSDGNWHHVVAIFDQGLDTLKCYVDGYIVGMVIDHVIPTWPNPDNTGYEVINPSLSSDTIKVDEIRFYKTLPTEDDILTQFNNQNDPATFSLCGPEESNLVADFSASPLSGVASLSVQFTDTSLGTPTSWAWDFGDSATSTEQNPTHVYSAAGVYTVVLRAARGSSEDTETKSEYIKINFTDSITKYAYIILTPRLSTDDAAIPPSRPELRVVYADGVGNYLFIKKGVRVILPAQSSIEEGSGFARSSGPSVIFD